MTRRKVLGSALAATVAAGGNPSAEPAGADAPPPLDGEIRFDEPLRAAAAEDFGHLVHRTPDGVLLPGSARDVGVTVRWAARRGHGFAAQGQRHSVFGRSQVRDGIVADLRQLRTVHSVQDTRVVVDAGATWREVIAATLPHGRTPPVLTDYLDLSVGGTLVVGGVGATTSRFGVQSDNVLDLTVVTGRGEVVTCSPRRDAELFDAARAGLGQVAIITRATLRLVAAPRQVRRYQLFYRSPSAMLTDARTLTRDPRFDAVQGTVLAQPAGWTFRLDAVKELAHDPPADDELLDGLSDERAEAQLTTLPYIEYLNRLDALEQALRANGQWSLPHPWLTTFVGDTAVESVVDAELERLTPTDLGPFGQVVISPIRRRPVRSPLLRLPSDELCFTFNLIRIPASDKPGDVDRLVADNRAIYDRVHAAGGTLYPVSAFPMSHDDWRRHFGPAFDQLNAAKHRHDPHHVLTPGYEVF